MKLIFKKDESNNILIQIVTGTTTIDFTYVDMIKGLLSEKNFDAPLFEGDFSEDEQERINSLLEKISIAIAETEEQKQD